MQGGNKKERNSYVFARLDSVSNQSFAVTQLRRKI